MFEKNPNLDVGTSWLKCIRFELTEHCLVGDLVIESTLDLLELQRKSAVVVEIPQSFVEARCTLASILVRSCFLFPASACYTSLCLI